MVLIKRDSIILASEGEFILANILKPYMEKKMIRGNRVLPNRGKRWVSE